MQTLPNGIGLHVEQRHERNGEGGRFKQKMKKENEADLVQRHAAAGKHRRRQIKLAHIETPCVLHDTKESEKLDEGHGTRADGAEEQMAFLIFFFGYVHFADIKIEQGGRRREGEAFCYASIY